MIFDQCTLRYEDDFILTDSTMKPWALNTPYSLGKYTLAIVVEQGTADVLINGTFRCHVQEKGIIYLLFDSIFLFEDISDDFVSQNMVLSNAFCENLGLDIEIDLPWRLQQNPFLPLNNLAIESVKNLFAMCKGVLQYHTPICLPTLQHLMRAYFLAFNYYYHSKVLDIEHPTREHKLTQQFFTLLRQNAHKEHSVQFYADQLFITPKYLTTCIRKATGKSAKQCIDNYLIAQAQHLLTTMQARDKKSSLLSLRNIAEVSYELGFSDPAAFSRYFYNQTGQRPRDWREQKR